MLKLSSNKLCQPFGLLILSVILLTTEAEGPALRMNEREFEVEFMSRMADHHAGALIMAQLCREKAMHQELKNLCEEMAALQAEEIATLKSWLKGWYSLEYEPRPPAATIQQVKELSALSGPEFEILFMKMLVMHHAQAIIMSAECLHKAFHAKLDKLCMKIPAMQLEEIKKLKTWLCAWYEICEGQNRLDDMPMAPRLQSLSLEGTDLHFSFFAEPDKAYNVVSKPYVTSDEWVRITTIAGVSGVQTVHSDIKAADSRIFQVVESAP
jgi:uncharacterized protein (DUF305 family)